MKRLFVLTMLLLAFGMAFAQTSGGPDSYGYTWRNSDDAQGPDYSWVTPAGTQVNTGWSDDSAQGPYPIGFDFPYYETTVNQFWVCSNGYISFVTGQTQYTNGTIPEVAVPNNAVYLYWDDFGPTNTAPQSVWYQNTTVNGMNAMVITYEAWPRLAGADQIMTAQVILFANGDILLQYNAFADTFDATSGTIGIENFDGSDGLQYQANTDMIDGGQAIRFYRPIPMDHDLMAVSVTGNTMPTQGTPVTHTVNVRNRGAMTETAYQVKLYRTGNVLLGTLPGVSIATNQTLPFEFTWTPANAGATQVWGVVEMASDGDQTNNTTGMLDLAVTPSGTANVYIGDPTTTTTHVVSPVNVYWWHSLTETLYYPDEFNGVSGLISSVSYFNHFLENVTPKHLTIFMGTTTQNDLTGGWIPAGELTQVFDGDVSMPIGDNTINIVLDTPFVYAGNNLVVLIDKADSDYDASTNQWRCTTTANHPNRGLYIAGDNDTNNYDPFNPPTAPTPSSVIANTVFQVATGGAGILTGTVTSNGNPVEGALVSLAGFPVTQLTNATGVFNFPFVAAGTYVMTVSKFGFNDTVIQNVVVTEDQTTTQNAVLVPLPMVTVTGTVLLSDTGGPANGATVSLFGYDDYEGFTTNAAGVFTIPNVYSNHDYTIEISLEGYADYSNTITVGGVDLNLGNITIGEVAYAPSHLMATQNQAGTTASLIWNVPTAGTQTEFRYDDGTATAQLGFGANPNAVMGGAYMRNAVIEEVSWYLTSNAVHTEAIIHIFGLDETGRPLDSQHLHESALLPNVDDQWNTYVLPEPIECPNGFMVGVCTPGVFTAIGTDDGIGAPYEFQLGTQWGIADWTAGTNSWLDVGPAGFPYNFTIRAHGIDYGEITRSEPVTRNQFTGPNPFNTGKPTEPVYTGEPSWNRTEIRSAANRNEVQTLDTRSLVGYNVYRFLMADEENEAAWTTLATNVTDTTYVDNTWNTAATGLYKFAVKAIYTGGNLSPANISNWLAKNYFGSVTANITTNVGEVPAGAELRLTCLTPDPSGNYPEYEVLANAAGVATVPQVWMGTYTLRVVYANYTTYTMENFVVDGAETVNIQLIEQHNPVSHVVAAAINNNTQAQITWDLPSSSGMAWDFEADNGEYVSSDAAGFQWGEAATGGAHSGTKVWATVLAGEYANDSNYNMVSPAVNIGTDYFLTFWHWYDIEDNYDGGVVKISTDGGANWTVIEPEGGYPNTANTANPLGEGTPCFGGTQTTWTLASFDLSAYDGEEAMFQFAFGSDPSVVYDGWYIDDVFVGVPEDRGGAFAAIRNAVKNTQVRSHNRRIDAEAVRLPINYVVYRLLEGNENNEPSWTQLGTPTTNSFIDTAFGTQPSDVYVYAVKANYTGNVMSEAAFSNDLPNNMTVPVTVNVSNDAQDPVTGAVVVFTHNDGNPEHVYTATATASGVLNMVVWRGAYAITCNLAGFAPFATTQTFNAQGTVNIQLLEVRNPISDLEYNVTGNNVHLTWSEPGQGGGGDSFADDFSGADFDNWFEYIQGPGTPGTDNPNPFWYLEAAPITPLDGACASVDWGYDIDTWLVTPLIEIAASTQIAFAWNASYYWSVDPNDNCDLFVKVSTDGNTWTSIWTFGDLPEWTNFEWMETVLQTELQPYIGQSVYIAFNLVGNDNADTKMDSVVIGAGNRATGTRVLSDQIAYTGDMTVKSVPVTNGSAVRQTANNRVVPSFDRHFVGYKIVRYTANVPTVLETSWTDEEYFDMGAPAGLTKYAVIAVYSSGESSPVETPQFNIGSGTEDPNAPAYVTELKGNFPNPFNPETKIRFSLANSEKVTIDIYNLKGQKVKTLVNDTLTAGNHEVVWKGQDDNGQSVSSGVYFYNMKSGTFTSTQKMILLK